MNLSFSPRAFILVCATFLFSACSTPEQYYRLMPQGAAPTRGSGSSIGVGPISLPSYLDRAEIVFQSGTNQFQVPSNARWAGSLGDNISRVLAADLGRILRSGNVLSHPWPAGITPRYQIAIDIQQFHSISGSDAILEASWRIENPATAQTFSRRSASFREPISGDGYPAIVAAQSRLLDRLAADIARSLPRS